MAPHDNWSNNWSDNMNIIRRARGTEIPMQARRVFLCYDARNTEDTVALVGDLLSHDAGMDCVVSWIEAPDADLDENLLGNELRESQALVLWVTKELLEAMRAEGLPMEFRLARQANTPILPIAAHEALLPEFTRLAGPMHGIATSDPEYRGKLKAQLETILGSEELNKEIREQAFTATVFLSYRKMDIDEARKFMKALHDLEEFVAVSVWYDSFLTAGEDYNQEIEKALTASDGFVLLVTPNLATEGHYVQTTEYPMAAAKQKPVVSVETLATDAARFAQLFPGTEIVVPLSSPAALRAAFRDKLAATASLPQLDGKYAHLLGMAYLRGIGVERDFERAMRLLEFAAKECGEAGLRAAKQLADIYENGLGANIDYNKALAWRKKEVAYSEQLLGREHPDTAAAYNNIAMVYSYQGEYAQALEFNEKALAVWEKVLGQEHPDTAQVYNNIAGVYSRQGEYTRALEYYQKALAIREKVLGKEHPDTAASYNNIAGVYFNQSDYAQALEWLQKALAIYEKRGQEHPNTVETYNNIATVYLNQGEYTRALEWYQKALAIYEKVLGQEHPDTAGAYNSIAIVYYNQGEYARALEWYEKALVIREKVLGKEHPDTALTYNSIADVYDNQGEYAHALEWYQQALAIYEKVLSKEHPDTALSYNNIGIVYDNQGDYVRALEFYEKALAVREKMLGEHPDTALTYRGIARAYREQGEYALALAWFQKALTIYEKVLGEHPDTATAYGGIALVYDKQGEYARALEYSQKALAIYEKTLGKEHPATVSMHDAIAELRARMDSQAG